MKQLTKGTQQIAHRMVLEEEIARLRNAVEVATKHKTRKRHYIQAEETLIVGEVADLVAAREVIVMRGARRLRRGCGQRGTAAVAAKLGITPALVR
jgi:LPS O-antigen subunit length determinant protein (WzzB/FepE family)